MNQSERQFTLNLLKVFFVCFLILSTFLLYKFFNTSYKGIIDNSPSSDELIDKKSFLPLTNNDLFQLDLRKVSFTYLIPQSVKLTDFEKLVKSTFEDKPYFEPKIQKISTPFEHKNKNLNQIELYFFLSDEPYSQLYQLIKTFRDLLQIQDSKLSFSGVLYDLEDFNKQFTMTFSKEKIIGFEFVNIFKYKGYLYTNGLSFFGLPELFVKSRLKLVRLNEIIKQTAHQLIAKEKIDLKGSLLLTMDKSLNYQSTFTKAKNYQTTIQIGKQTIPGFNVRTNRIRFLKERNTKRKR
ncbi:MAG: hypothetical protein KC646_01480 [Candidatus Cloacimonetes bacterium]|nr:hypothetical protein [Candidatus Cloacimonadota bacterium]